MSEQPKPHILLTSPPPDVLGGVAAFAESLAVHLQNYQADRFYVGHSAHTTEAILAKLYRLLISPIRLVHALMKQKYAVIHLNPSLNRKALLRDGLLAITLRLVRCQRVLVMFHGWQPDMAAMLSRNSLARMIFLTAFGGAARIAVLAKDFKESLIKIGIKTEKIIVVRTMFDDQLLDNLNEISGGQAGNTILFMSRFDSEKGAEPLLRAFALIANDFPSFDLVVAGSGSEDAKLRKMAFELNVNNRVKFPGYVGGADKTRLLNNCTIFALPTTYPEGMPVVVLEAMAAGKPLLTTGAGGLKDFLYDGEHGVILEHVSPESIAEGLRFLLSHPELAAEIGHRNAMLAQKHFSASHVTSDFERLYTDIAKG